ncbi:MAG: DUF4214 domain-containing protein [Leptospiraceae bacterium]|nr:DUF4214 domain-containing protein [Leptospiraceae bacterium]MCP5495765.1 DUF4214 domain-containing protein [Leptospiraceae bacterium]
MNTEEIRQKIRSEIERQKSFQKDRNIHDITSFVHDLNLGLFPEPEVPKNAPLTPNNFLSLFDEDFINIAYLAILNREPKEEELKFYLDKLRQGKVDRIEILGRLRYSREGKRQNVPFINLRSKYYLRKVLHIPFIGIWFKLIIHIISLPKSLALIHTHEAHALWRFRMMEKKQFQNIEAIYWSLQEDLETIKMSIQKIEKQLENKK